MLGERIASQERLPLTRMAPARTTNPHDSTNMIAACCGTLLCVDHPHYAKKLVLMFPDFLALAAELKNLGAGFKSDNRRKTLTAPGRVRQMCRHYPKAADGRTLASYEAAWITWRRPA